MRGPFTGRARWSPDDWRAFVAANPGKGPAALGRLCGKATCTVAQQTAKHGLVLPDERKGEANAERMRRRHADPKFAKAHAERAAERMRRLNADGTLHPHLAHLSPPQRDAYRAARKVGCTKDEAMREAERTPA